MNTDRYVIQRSVLAHFGIGQADNGIRNAVAHQAWTNLTQDERSETLAWLAQDREAGTNHRISADEHYCAIMHATGGRSFDEFAALIHGAEPPTFS